MPAPIRVLRKSRSCGAEHRRFSTWTPNDLRTLRRAKAALDPHDAELIEKVFDSYRYLADVIGEKSMSIGRLQKLLFGAKTEKTDQVVGKSDSPASTLEQESTKDAEETERNEADKKPPPKGHGRNAAEAYQGAERIAVPQGSLHTGDPCPECGKGTLYEKRPAVVVRITGQAPLCAKKYELQRLRCGLCGKVFTADLPNEAGQRKYDAKAGAMIGLLKYGCGLPFNRMDGLQGNLEIPLPASTQWDVVSSFAPALEPAFDEFLGKPLKEMWSITMTRRSKSLR